MISSQPGRTWPEPWTVLNSVQIRRKGFQASQMFRTQASHFKLQVDSAHPNCEPWDVGQNILANMDAQDQG